MHTHTLKNNTARVNQLSINAHKNVRRMETFKHYGEKLSKFIFFKDNWQYLLKF